MLIVTGDLLDAYSLLPSKFEVGLVFLAISKSSPLLLDVTTDVCSTINRPICACRDQGGPTTGIHFSRVATLPGALHHSLCRLGAGRWGLARREHLDSWRMYLHIRRSTLRRYQMWPHASTELWHHRPFQSAHQSDTTNMREDRVGCP